MGQRRLPQKRWKDCLRRLTKLTQGVRNFIITYSDSQAVVYGKDFSSALVSMNNLAGKKSFKVPCVDDRIKLIDRDTNGARNILIRFISKHEQPSV